MYIFLYIHNMKLFVVLSLKTKIYPKNMPLIGHKYMVPALTVGKSKYCCFMFKTIIDGILLQTSQISLKLVFRF